METAFLTQKKFNFHALQTTICLEVKEVDVSTRDGIHAYQNAKVGLFLFFLQLALWANFSARTIFEQPSTKKCEGGRWREKSNLQLQIEIIM